MIDGSEDELLSEVGVVGVVGEELVGSLLELVDADGVELAPPAPPSACAPPLSVAKRSRPSSSKMRNKTVRGIHLLVLYIFFIPQFFSG